VDSGTGGAGGAPARSTCTSIEAIPRAAAPGAPPQATTDSVALPAGALERSTCRVKSRLAEAGSKSWKSFSASPTNSSTRLRRAAAEALPFTASTPLTVEPAAGWLMLTVPASGSVVGQVLGMAPAGPAPAADQTAPATQARQAATSAPHRPLTASGAP
jgi:hypothetical protein